MEPKPTNHSFISCIIHIRCSSILLSFHSFHNQSPLNVVKVPFDHFLMCFLHSMSMHVLYLDLRLMCKEIWVHSGKLHTYKLTLTPQMRNLKHPFHHQLLIMYMKLHHQSKRLPQSHSNSESDTLISIVITTM